MGFLNDLFGSYSEREIKKIKPLAKKVLDLEEKYSMMSDEELSRQTQVLKDRLKSGETLDDILFDSFAVVREASFRVLNMQHFEVQIIGGIALHQGRISEMRTGEGKTLVCTLPAYLNALSGDGVHVITVNDYLAKRDSDWMGKIYKFLGLTVGLVVSGLKNNQKREAYNCDITYGTNNEYGFDYLRDNMVIYKEHKVQRNFNFAIIDEVDSILIDEARTPLIISGQGDKSTDLYILANKFANTLTNIKVKEIDTKEDTDSTTDADYIIDEKAKTSTLTKNGVKKSESYFGIENLTDGENLTIQHHINQAIKANSVMVRDIDYVVREGQVIIVDEFTGRLMDGRRYSDGLHQAIEAKENVKVERESKTLATITFQNYFRLYKKLSGMTGTAMTEEDEFRQIYSLDVLSIPTNKEIKRKDFNDLIYKTEKAKYNAVLDKTLECYDKGQPVLVGTVSIEKSEYLSKLLSKRGVKHNVLNAKHHEKEAEIIAQAGKFKAITIATNMAGRGTDIVLGGNPEYIAKNYLRKSGVSDDLINQCDGHASFESEELLSVRKQYEELVQKCKKDIEEEAEKVKNVGGLCIIGTERHESRRIDNQLRGRSGRQGDVGETTFYLSLEDDLMRLFGGERIYTMMDKLKLDEETTIENKIITSQIESAQKKIEGRNFSVRKNVLGFDDVMNAQRKTIYIQRDRVLNGENINEYIKTIINESISNTCDLYINEDTPLENWNIVGLNDYYLGILTDDDKMLNNLELNDDNLYNEIRDTLLDMAIDIYDKKENEVEDNVMREIERVVLLSIVDKKWMEHIDNMDELKKGIYLRSYAQKDPVTEYRIEGFNMFDDMIDSIKDELTKAMLTVNVDKKDLERKAVAKPMSEGFENNNTKKISKQPIQVYKIGRNELCKCGSGLKYKKCCGK
ncbi:MAG: preprotein translocase subunit SecA [Oscillospiraceae bacterium]